MATLALIGKAALLALVLYLAFEWWQRVRNGR